MRIFPGKNLFEKGFPSRNCFLEECFEFSAFFAPDGDMVVCPQEAGLKFSVRGHPEPVAECTELGIVQRAHDFYFSTVKAVFFPVMHPAREDLFRSCGQAVFHAV